MLKTYKRKYRTNEGIINQIYHKGNGWIENQKKSTNIMTVPFLKLIFTFICIKKYIYNYYLLLK